MTAFIIATLTFLLADSPRELRPGYLVALSPDAYTSCRRAEDHSPALRRLVVTAGRCRRSVRFRGAIVDPQTVADGVVSFLWRGRRYWAAADAIRFVPRRFRVEPGDA